MLMERFSRKGEVENTEVLCQDPEFTKDEGMKTRSPLEEKRSLC